MIWCNWKRHFYKDAWFSPLLNKTANQVNSLIGAAILFFLLNIYPINWGANLRYGRPGLDWFDPEHLQDYKRINLTNVRVVECATSLFGVYLISSFPSYLRIFGEYISIFSLNFFCFMIIEFYRSLKYTTNLGKIETEVLCCKFDFLLEILRSTLFSLILSYYSMYKPEPRVPPEMMDNLYHFSNDIKCLEYFKMYIVKKHPDAIAIFIEASRRSIVSMSSTIEVVLEDSNYNEELLPYFDKYRKTKSFHTLKQLRISENRLATYGFSNVSG